MLSRPCLHRSCPCGRLQRACEVWHPLPCLWKLPLQGQLPFSRGTFLIHLISLVCLEELLRCNVICDFCKVSRRDTLPYLYDHSIKSGIAQSTMYIIRLSAAARISALTLEIFCTLSPFRNWLWLYIFMHLGFPYPMKPSKLVRRFTSALPDGVPWGILTTTAATCSVLSHSYRF